MAKKRGLYDNINAKRDRIKAGSGEKMRSAGDKGAPSAQDFKDAAKTAKKKDGGLYKMADGGMYKMAGGGMPGGTMLKMKDGGLAVQSKGCGTVDNKRRKPTKLR
jgi:hypothetical protein|tara:strand:+ start:523 stop:837 length:315 start_codon:yes stop_codon:yes gene_type:complete